jgi:hypothetical protein
MKLDDILFLPLEDLVVVDPLPVAYTLIPVIDKYVF